MSKESGKIHHHKILWYKQYINWCLKVMLQGHSNINIKLVSLISFDFPLFIEQNVLHSIFFRVTSLIQETYVNHIKKLSE